MRHACASARAIASSSVRQGYACIVPAAPTESEGEAFRFMSSNVSTERPKGLLVAERRACHATPRTPRRKKVLFVGGPAIVHGGSRRPCSRSSCAAASSTCCSPATRSRRTTSSPRCSARRSASTSRVGASVPHGHQHHLRAINRVRRAGSIKAAVEHRARHARGHARVRHEADPVRARRLDPRRRPAPRRHHRRRRRRRRDARARPRRAASPIIVATTLHGVATGNMLPATRRDVLRRHDAEARSSSSSIAARSQAVGIVTDCEYFLSELARVL